MKTMSKLLMVAGIVVAFAAQSAVAGERAGPAPGISSEKSMPSHESFSGDVRDCLYAHFGSKGKDWHEANYHYVRRVLKKCFCNYGKSDV